MSTAEAHVFDADDYPAAVTREVPGLGACRIEDLRMDEAMRLFAVEQPHRLNYRHWASDFIATAVSDPRLEVSDVERLSDFARGRLLAAAAESNGCGSSYRSLADSHLNPDERLFAAYYTAMREHFRALATMGAKLAAQVGAGVARSAATALRPVVEASARRLVQPQGSLARIVRGAINPRLAGSEHLARPSIWVPARVHLWGRSPATASSEALGRPLSSLARFIVTNREPIRGGLIAYEALRALSRYGERHQRLWEIDERVRTFSEGPLGYLIEPLRLGVALEVIALVEDDGEAALLDLLECAVRDEQVVMRLRAAIGELTLLSDSKRRRLDHALEHLAAGEYLFVVDTLIAVVEGLFWTIASEREVIDERDRFTHHSGFRGVARGLEKLLTPLGISGGFRTFLVHRSYGGRGHPFRHGRADEGEREQVLFLMVALAGWLETFAGVPARRWLMAALERELSSRTLVGSALTVLDASGNPSRIRGQESSVDHGGQTCGPVVLR